MTRLLQISCVLTLVGLALMVWSMLAPTPMPVILAMSVGQLLGTVAFGMFGYVVLVDQLRKQRAKGAARARELASELANDASHKASPKASS
jgi:cbb3-type cytochrome oxidase subunit 3